MEHMLAEHYRARGYDVDHVGTGASHGRYDGGIDLKLRKGSEYILVQCKHWNAYQVTHNAVHELLGIMVNQGATGAILVTSGEFTRAAIEAATRQGHVQLVDGDDLREMIGPLPEPEAKPASQLYSGAARAAGGFAANAAERLVLAAEDRIRHGAGRHGRSNAATTGLLLILLKFAFAGALLLFFGFVLQNAIKGIGKTTRAQAATPRPPRIQPLPQPIQPAAGDPAAVVGSAAVAQRPAPAATIGTGMSEADLREWRRRNTESMKILEATTPELKRKPVAEAQNH
jgi:hypothetical protein